MKGTLIFGAAMFVERVVSFLLLPLLTKEVTPEEYAIWSQSVMITGMMVPVVLLGFQTAVIKFFPSWDNQKKMQNSVMFFMVSLIFILFCLIAAITLIFDEQVANFIFGKPQLSLYVPWLLALLFSEVFFEFLVAVLRISNRIRKVSIYMLMKGIWRSGILLLVLIFFNGSYYLAFISFVLLQLVITLFIYMWEIHPINLVKGGLRLSRSHWNDILKFSLPLVPLAVLLAINTFVVRIFLAHFHNLEILAIYSAGFSFSAIIAFFYGVLTFTLFPELSKKWVNRDKVGIFNLMRKVIIAYLALLFPFLVFISTAGNDTLLLLTTSNYNISSTVLLLMSINIGLYGLYQIFFYLVFLQKGTLQAPLLLIIVAGVNIFFSMLLVPNYDIFGATVAGFISNFLLAATAFHMSKQAFKWQFPLADMLRIFFRSLVMGLVILTGFIWFDNTWISLMLILIIAGSVYGLLDFFDKKSSLIRMLYKNFGK